VKAAGIKWSDQPKRRREGRRFLPDERGVLTILA
jgi:hypothetical protein